MSRPIILLLLNILLMMGSSLVLGGEPVSVEPSPVLPSDSLNDPELQGPGIWDLVHSIAIFIGVICLLFLCSWLLKRWQPAARQHGDEIVMASATLKDEKLAYWLKAGLATVLLWSNKYLILNFLIASYVSLDLTEHVLVFGKQLVIWTVML
ncbi:MAG: hypothetical protein MI749_19050, partial [Desulfovibrionales bacterium]|nr:hypothetical protein [Desulfovibrionales bacterium]